MRMEIQCDCESNNHYDGMPEMYREAFFSPKQSSLEVEMWYERFTSWLIWVHKGPNRSFLKGVQNLSGGIL